MTTEPNFHGASSDNELFPPFQETMTDNDPEKIDTEPAPEPTGFRLDTDKLDNEQTTRPGETEK